MIFTLLLIGCAFSFVFNLYFIKRKSKRGVTCLSRPPAAASQGSACACKISSLRESQWPNSSLQGPVLQNFVKLYPFVTEMKHADRLKEGYDIAPAYL
jgi:hypothetical protein